MSRKTRHNKPQSSPYIQLAMNFDEVASQSDVLSREQVRYGDRYDPIQKTAEYMKQLVESQQQWDSTIKTAREKLLKENAIDLYFRFIMDMKRRIESNAIVAPRLSKILAQVALNGLGMTRDHIQIQSPPRGSSHWKIIINETLVLEHLSKHIVGDNFLNYIDRNDQLWKTNQILIGSSDVSQHRASVPAPARFFNRTVPFLLNNAAGAIVSSYRDNSQPSIFEIPRFNPQPNQEVLEWMLIDPSYQDELDPEDFMRCTSSAMDIGQYVFDHDFLLNADKSCPEIVLRDGSLFPQDAFLDNYVIDNRRGLFTRQAIRELLKCLNAAKMSNRLYCGVAKNVQLRVYSSIMDWYISTYIDKNLQVGNYTLRDGEAMTLLLSSPEFSTEQNRVLSTCLIKRSFTTRSTLNIKAPNLNDLDTYFDKYQARLNEEMNDINIDPYRQLCSLFHVYMFFIGHSSEPNSMIPRYEFFTTENHRPQEILGQIWDAILRCSFFIDTDHSFMNDKSEDPIIYMIPSVTQQAHVYSKDLGHSLTDKIKGDLWSRYNNLVHNMV